MILILRHLTICFVLCGFAAIFLPRSTPAQQAPPAPSAARILLLPRRIPAGERATLAVLDVDGRLTPGVTVNLSSGSRVTTDATGRVVFLAPTAPGTLFASLNGRPGRVPVTIVPPAAELSPVLAVRAVPRYATLTDRFELSGAGFCNEADANRVNIGGRAALVLAASSVSLVVLPPENLAPGPASVTVACGDRTAHPFSMVFVALDLTASSAPLAPNERRTLLIRVRGTPDRLSLEARNLAPEIAELAGGNPVRLTTTGGPENSARFELSGRSHGNFLISIRLLPSYTPPRP